MSAPRILAVDDDPLTLKFLARVLNAAGGGNRRSSCRIEWMSLIGTAPLLWHAERQVTERRGK